MPDLARDFLICTIRLHVLYRASRAPIYGVEMLEELRRHGYPMSPGTLYPVLHEMYADGYLECERRVIAGKARKYYRATDMGIQALQAARPKIRDFIAEVLHDASHVPGTREEADL